MTNCNECLYSYDGICQKDECSFDIEDNCYEYESRWTYDIGYQQGRADAIEEYKNRLLELCDCGIERADCVGGNCLKCMENVVDYSSIIDMAEELKEKKK